MLSLKVLMGFFCNWGNYYCIEIKHFSVNGERMFINILKGFQFTAAINTSTTPGLSPNPLQAQTQLLINKSPLSLYSSISHFPLHNRCWFHQQPFFLRGPWKTRNYQLLRRIFEMHAAPYPYKTQSQELRICSKKGEGGEKDPGSWGVGRAGGEESWVWRSWGFCFFPSSGSFTRAHGKDSFVTKVTPTPFSPLPPSPKATP